MTEDVPLNRGSGLLVDFTLTDEDGDAVNLTSATVSIVETSSVALAAQLSVSVVSPATAGVVRVKVVWDTTAMRGVPSFRVQSVAAADEVFPEGQRSTTPLIRLAIT